MKQRLEAKGIVPLGWYDAGARSFYNSVQPINTPADVAGLKIRVMSNDLFVQMVESSGVDEIVIEEGDLKVTVRKGAAAAAPARSSVTGSPSAYTTLHHESRSYLRPGTRPRSDHLRIVLCATPRYFAA